MLRWHTRRRGVCGVCVGRRGVRCVWGVACGVRRRGVRCVRWRRRRVRCMWRGVRCVGRRRRRVRCVGVQDRLAVQGRTAGLAAQVRLAVQERLGEQVRLAARLRRAAQDRLQPRIGRLGRRGDCTGGLVRLPAGLRLTGAVEGWRWVGGGAHQHVLGVAQDRVREEDAEEHGGQRYLPPVTVTVGVERSGGSRGTHARGG